MRTSHLRSSRGDFVIQGKVLKSPDVISRSARRLKKKRRHKSVLSEVPPDLREGEYSGGRITSVEKAYRRQMKHQKTRSDTRGTARCQCSHLQTGSREGGRGKEGGDSRTDRVEQSKRQNRRKMNSPAEVKSKISPREPAVGKKPRRTNRDAIRGKSHPRNNGRKICYLSWG